MNIVLHTEVTRNDKAVLIPAEILHAAVYQKILERFPWVDNVYVHRGFHTYIYVFNINNPVDCRFDRYTIELN